jgi:hypothetical protein
MKLVYCTFRIPGFHNWPDAPEGMSFLRKEHRHEFHFKITVEVEHDNREIEFLKMKLDCINFVRSLWEVDIADNLVFDHMSCEMIAEQLLMKLIQIKKYSMQDNINDTRRQIIVEVSEDGENGGIITRL